MVELPHFQAEGRGGLDPDQGVRAEIFDAPDSSRQTSAVDVGGDREVLRSLVRPLAAD